MIAHTVLHVAADDRTGALEVAAALADRGVGGEAGVEVAVWPHSLGGDAGVVDLGSRHLSPREAARRAGDITVAGPVAHKIDSTLRGNWAHELVGRQRATDRPVLLVPALPALGRTCVEGVVLVGGAPVHHAAVAGDVRHAPSSSRPAEHLRLAGASDVLELHVLSECAGWLAAPHGVAVADASTTEEIESIVGEWSRRPGVLLAGTSAVIAAAAVCGADLEPRHIPSPALVVCGSLHAAARRQIALAVARGAVHAVDAASVVAALRTGLDAIVSTDPVEGRVEPEHADRVAAALATTTRAIVDSVPRLGALVVIGGDTAAAVLGDATVRVQGSVTPGTARLQSPLFAPPVVTRAGGFGDERGLVDLLWGTLRS